MVGADGGATVDGNTAPPGVYFGGRGVDDVSASPLGEQCLSGNQAARIDYSGGCTLVEDLAGVSLADCDTRGFSKPVPVDTVSVPTSSNSIVDRGLGVTRRLG